LRKLHTVTKLLFGVKAKKNFIIMATITISQEVCRYLEEVEGLALRRRIAIQDIPLSGKCADFNIPHDTLTSLLMYNALNARVLQAPHNKRKRESSLNKSFNYPPNSGISLFKKIGRPTQSELIIKMHSPTEISSLNDKVLPAKKAKHKDIRWLSNFDHLKKYKDSHGDCIVPRGYSIDPRLASWVAEQRKQRKLLLDGKQSSMIPERTKMLDAIGFVWNAQEAAWERHFCDLKQFRVEEGHCLVPVGHIEHPKLGFWVKEQRRHYFLMKQGKQSNMSEERASKLDSIEFCWNTYEALWLERFHELCKYKEIHGHSVVPTKCAENQRLGTWVHHQRREYRKFKQGKPSHMRKERISSLESIGFVWFPR
jgi:hypothetical protein